MDLRDRFERDCDVDPSERYGDKYENPIIQVEWETYQAGHAAAAAEIAELRAKVEAAEKDAARWRYYRDTVCSCMTDAIVLPIPAVIDWSLENKAEQIDAAIDAARNK